MTICKECGRKTVIGRFYNSDRVIELDVKAPVYGMVARDKCIDGTLLIDLMADSFVPHEWVCPKGERKNGNDTEAGSGRDPGAASGDGIIR